MDNIKKRLYRFCVEETANKILDGMPDPPLGTPINDMPAYTTAFMDRLMKHLDTDVYEKVLCGNNHQIPGESMMAEKEAYECATS